MDGNCQKTSDEKNADFGKSVTQLAAVSSAASDVKNQNVNPAAPYSVSIFTGQEAECRIYPLGTLNCCKDTGWGKGIFFNCHDNEKHLGLSKEKGLVVSTGSYCRHKTLFGICSDKRETHCIFPSKLAYDVQVYGRQDQLGRNFGNGKNTNCSGLSSTDMQHINFSKITFSNVVSDVENQKTLPDPTQKKEKNTNSINKESGSINPNPYFKSGF
jgi:conjugal transfer mating pair stabilization protein TraN